MRSHGRSVPTDRIRFVLIGIALSLFSIPSVSPAGEWRVTPIRLDLGREARSGAITVINEAEGRLQVQVKAYEWTQDEEGKDRYEETEDLLFFPKMILFTKNEERIIRAGIRMPPAAREKTYRLFIEEIPEPGKAEGATVAIAIRFGIPIFVKPLKEEVKAEIEKIWMSNGIVAARVRNGGNRHLVILSVVVKGKNGRSEEIFTKELSGWYLLAGASRLYTTAVPPDVCSNLARLDIEVKTDTVTIPGSMVVEKSMCMP
jgi:fimbrial chaperone protein